MTHQEINSMATVAIHSLQAIQPEHAHLPPIFASSAFTFDSAEQGMKRFSGAENGYTYSRFGNPTTSAAASVIAGLETFGLKDAGGKPLQAKGLLTASGQAAMAAMFLSNLSSGDKIVSSRSLYGGTHEFIVRFLSRFGVNCKLINMNDFNLLEDVMRKDKSIKLLHIETPANPTMQCIDISAVCRIAKQYGKLVTIDNTFATPYLQQPFESGVDYIFHSTTKFLNGHGSAIGGVLIGTDLEKMNREVYDTYKLLGGNANPFDAFMLMQGVKTLALRMDKHCGNAEAIAGFLAQHAAVAVVNYNGLSSHPDYEISKRQMRHAGAVLSFELKEGFAKAVRFIDKLKVCTRAVSLGTVDTLVSHPASMSHSGMLPEERIKAGVTDGLIRMSAGLEDIDDLLNDLEQALT